MTALAQRKGQIAAAMWKLPNRDLWLARVLGPYRFSPRWGESTQITTSEQEP